jgi:hypothetical protein
MPVPDIRVIARLQRANITYQLVTCMQQVVAVAVVQRPAASCTRRGCSCFTSELRCATVRRGGQGCRGAGRMTLETARRGLVSAPHGALYGVISCVPCIFIAH